MEKIENFKKKFLQTKIEKSTLYFKKSQKIVPGGVHSPVRSFKGVGGIPRFIESSTGVELRDIDGNTYLDYCLSWGPLIFGHADPQIRQSVQDALFRGWSYGTAEPYSLALAECITENLPWVEKIRFVNSGTEAVMSALRVARAATGRSKVLKFNGCYHGHVDSLLVKAGSGLADMASPDSAGVSPQVASETLVAELDDLSQVQEIFQLHGKTIAAVIIEPIPANNGLLLQTEFFLKKTCEIAREYGALVIFDEVITGFRVAFGGMVEKTGILPDLVTFGKIIGGGFPVGAYGGKADLMDWVAPSGPVYQAGTLSANPVAMVAGLAMLEKLKKENPYPELEKATISLALALEEAAKEEGFSLQVQNVASIFWMVFGQKKRELLRKPINIPKTHSKMSKTIFHALLNQGIYLAPSAFEVCFLSTVHEKKHHAFFIQKLQESLWTIKKNV